MQKITYYSLVKETEVKKTLFLGSLKAVVGILFIFFAGPFFFIPGVLMIGWGLLPYRMIRKLQMNPETLEVTEEHLILKNRIIRLDAITKMEFIEGERFGILIFTKERTLFAPYFSKRVFKDLTEQDHAS